MSPSTLISALSQLPQFYGNTNSDVRTAFFSSPGSGNLNLRGLNTGGSGRTLTLLDGRRVVPANGYGSVDINILPSALVKRVDTVTGGASAAYGTDAVAGAVNFILDTDYDGWQVNAQRRRHQPQRPRQRGVLRRLGRAARGSRAYAGQRRVLPRRPRRKPTAAATGMRATALITNPAAAPAPRLINRRTSCRPSPPSAA